ncbi:MAG TPA: hypothetical protein VMM27_04035 [Casimicrobiaceae bacterium]|nr:hypothetical protein [Casimicrobiaceae bacterium]
MSATYAAPFVRDRFLNSLESSDRLLSVQLALGLLGCGNPLPGVTCNELGLPVHSTYDCAARRVLALYSTDSTAKGG